MRVLLLADMEGIAQLTSYREILPIYPEYWREGQAKMRGDTRAAAQGLLDGGATEVAVVDGHGSGAANLSQEALPDGAYLYDWELFDERVRSAGFDALMQLGFHARCGVKQGFLSHTHVPFLRIAVDGTLVSESHTLAWSVGAPLIGIVGDSRHRDTLGAALAGTAFLAVKHGQTKRHTQTVFPNQASSDEAIRAFASQCMSNSGAWQRPSEPQDFLLEISIPGELTERAVEQGGLERKSPCVLSARCARWWEDGVPAVEAAVTAAFEPFIAAGQMESD